MKQITEGKVYKSIEKYVGNEKMFIIYPYGNRGKMVEQLLRENFNIQNCVLADNQPKASNKRDIKFLEKKYSIIALLL